MKGNRTGLVMIGMFLSVSLAGVVYGQTVRERVVGPTARVKDIATVKGVRDNMLCGNGLVVGLNGKGDGRRFTPAVQAI